MYLVVTVCLGMFGTQRRYENGDDKVCSGRYSHITGKWIRGTPQGLHERQWHGIVTNGFYRR